MFDVFVGEIRARANCLVFGERWRLRFIILRVGKLRLLLGLLPRLLVLSGRLMSFEVLVDFRALLRLRLRVHMMTLRGRIF